MHLFQQAVGTYTYDLVKVICCVNPQYLDCDETALVFALPHIARPAVIQRVIGSIITNWDFQ